MHYLFSSFDYDTLLLTPGIDLMEQYEGFCEHSRCAITIIDFVGSSFGNVLLYSQDVVFFGVVNAVLFLIKVSPTFSNTVNSSLTFHLIVESRSYEFRRR